MSYSRDETGLQALILCGPGTSFDTLLKPEGTPKCLALVANRPMVYYPMNLCRRLGITDVTLVTFPSAVMPIKAALQHDPFMGSFPSAKVLAPQDLEETTSTAQILRLPEVQDCIQGNFLLLPCDLVSELDQRLLDSWDLSQIQSPGELNGGLGLYYQTEAGIKDEVSDLVAVAPFEQSEMPGAAKYKLSRLVMSMGMDSTKARLEQDKAFLVRYSLTKKHQRIKIMPDYRDAHLYFFPHWVKHLVRHQEKIASIKEDLIGLWAKAQWQQGLAEKLGMDKCRSPQDSHQWISGQSMSSTVCQKPRTNLLGSESSQVEMAPFIACLLEGSTELVRRVDSPALLLSSSLRLAKLKSIETAKDASTRSPFSHAHKITSPGGIAQRSFISRDDCLLASNVVVEKGCSIKETCVGPGSKICSGARLTRCVVLENVIIGARCVLVGCVIGNRSLVGGNSTLNGCEVQEGFTVPERTEAKNEIFTPLLEDLLGNM
ncbi:unnamed protein product [Penicillium salamii]|nr:unnamed protein product [Penicillium salamii]CAG8402527.1 unnamed protein product [Penicillium salamii]